MASNNAWRVLSTGEADEVVLACDFPTAVRPEAQFSDFVAQVDPAVTIWESGVPKPGTETGWTADDYLTWWLEPLRESGVRVGGVLGFCAGSVYASELTRRLGELQSEEVPLVLFDPERPTSEALYVHYARGIEICGMALDRPAVDEMIAEGQELLARDTDLQVFGPAVNELYLRVADTALEQLGLNQQRRDELNSIFTSFVSWGVAAGHIDPTPGWARATCLSSEDHVVYPMQVRNRIAIAAPHERILASADAVRTALDTIALGVPR